MEAVVVDGDGKNGRWVIREEEKGGQEGGLCSPDRPS